jgi:UDP-N-acetylmuramoylalanine--D-glutamate ligase
VISILLNLGTNHLDRHPDHASYVAAKARLFDKQTPADYAILNGADAQVAALAGGIRAQLVWFGDAAKTGGRFELSEAVCQMLSPGQQAALQAARIIGVPDPLTLQSMREFKGLEHRMEYVATVRGVTFINDSKSTTPDSLLYALERTRGAVVPIIGGKDKGMDFSPLRQALADERVRGVVLIGETRNRLQDLLREHPAVRISPTLEEALNAALSLSRAGDTVLFSPACASFDMFRNFEERGRNFKHLIGRMTHSATTAAQTGGGR